MLKELANHLSLSDIRYCILHDWQSLPEHLPSDLDIVVAPEDLRALEGILRSHTGGRLIQLLQHESSCFYFVLVVEEDSKIRFVPVDVATDYRRDGRIFFTAEELLADRHWWNGFWVATPQVEYMYLLVKKVLKGTVLNSQKERLEELLLQLGDEAGPNARRLFGKRLGDVIISWISTVNWNVFEASIPRLRRTLLWQIVKHHPLNPLRYWVPELKRFWNRWRNPTGLSVAVLGPDGAGKTTLIRSLRENLGGAFRQTEVFHLRPGVMGPKGTNSPVSDPHGKPLYPLWLSLLKISYYFLDYSLGYLFRVRSRLVRSTLVLFDRYYDDLLVDPCRYRYGGPMRLARLAGLFIPKPDLFFILDVREEPLLARKQEVSPKEVKRQREAYRKLAMEIPNAVLLDGSMAPKEVARDASEAIVDYLYRRYLGRRHLWFHDDGSETLNWLASVLFSSEEMCFAPSKSADSGFLKQWQAKDSFGWLTLKDGRGYLIPLRSRQAGINAMHLYNVQKLKARLAKKVLTTGLKQNVCWPLLRTIQMLIHRDVSDEEKSQVSLLEHLKKILGRQDLTFAVSLGTPGLHRKPVIQVLTLSGKILGYVKVGWNEVTNALVRNEADVCRRLSGVSFDTFAVPIVLYADWWRDRFLCVQSAPEGRIEPAPQKFTSLYYTLLKELRALHVKWMPLEESAFWTSLMRRIDSIQSPSHRYILQQGVCRVEEWLKHKLLPFHFCHGDFAPWNAQLLNGCLFLFDWEYANLEAPPGWDLFHFKIQTLWLLEKRMPGEILKVVLDTVMENQMMHLESLSMQENDLKSLFMLYLLDRLAFYACEEKASSRFLQLFATQIKLCLYGGKL